MVKQARWIICLTLVAGIAIRAAEASEWQLVQDSSNVRFIGVVEGSARRLCGILLSTKCLASNPNDTSVELVTFVQTDMTLYGCYDSLFLC